MRIYKIIAIMAIAAGLVACSGETPTNSSGDGGGGSGGETGSGEIGGDDGGDGDGGGSLPDACTLATRAEVQTAVGGTVANGVVVNPSPNHYAFGEGAQCIFVADSGLVSPTWVTVFLATDESWTDFVKSQVDAFGSEPLPGVGDEAIIDTADIGVRSGGFAVTLQFGMYEPQGAGQRDRMIALAQTVVGRLPAG